MLDEYADERIEFMMMTKDAVPQQWSRVLYQAWDALVRDPPKQLQVRVADLPGDARRRKSQRCSLSTQHRVCLVTNAHAGTRRELLTVLGAVLGPMLAMMLLFGMIAMWASLDD